MNLLTLSVIKEKRENITVRDFDFERKKKEITVILDPSKAEFDGLMNHSHYVRGLMMQERPHPTGEMHLVFWSGYHAVHLSVVEALRDYDWSFDYQLEFEWTNRTIHKTWDRLGPYSWSGPQKFLETSLARLLGRTRSVS